MKIKFNFFQTKTNFWLNLNQLIFRFTFIIFIFFFIIDYFLPGFVTNWFNPLPLLFIALISAMISTLRFKKND
jgi:hypothetical protein